MVPRLSPCRTIQKDYDDGDDDDDDYEAEEEEEKVPLCSRGANIALFSLIPSTKRRQVNFTPRPLYPGDRAYRRLPQPLAANAQTLVQWIPILSRE